MPETRNFDIRSFITGALVSCVLFLSLLTLLSLLKIHVL
jgi:hypothetical protein